MSIQSDQGSNFMSGLMQQVLHELGVQQLKSSAYHPESQGAIERFHQTLKNMIRVYCFEYQAEWDQSVHMLPFTVREAVQDSLEFSPFELVFGHTVRGPLKLLKENWLASEPPTNLLDQMSDLHHRHTCELAQKNMKVTQSRMKKWYNKKAWPWTFKVGEKVLALLLLPNHPLQARFCGPYVVTKRVNDVNYVTHMPDHRKTHHLCHINMLKSYHEADNVASVATIAPMYGEEDTTVSKDSISRDSVMISGSCTLQNSEILANLAMK